MSPTWLSQAHERVILICEKSKRAKGKRSHVANHGLNEKFWGHWSFIPYYGLKVFHISYFRYADPLKFHEAAFI